MKNLTLILFMFKNPIGFRLWVVHTINISDEEKERLIKITINLDNNLFI